MESLRTVMDHGQREVEPVTGERMHLLDLDRELGEPVPPRERAAAHAAALVAVHDLPVGPWEPDLDSAPVGGFLIVHGCLTREMSVLGRATAVDFLAQGDVLHTAGEPVMTSVPAQATWSVLEPTRLALLDDRFLAAVQPWPQLTASLLARQERRCNWLAHILATSHLPPVEMRIQVLFWLFADRWGHKTSSGVSVPIPLTHLNIARLIGAQRPTVTTALNRLIEDGHLEPAGHWHWTLHGDPPDELRQQ